MQESALSQMFLLKKKYNWKEYLIKCVIFLSQNYQTNLMLQDILCVSVFYKTLDLMRPKLNM